MCQIVFKTHSKKHKKYKIFASIEIIEKWCKDEASTREVISAADRNASAYEESMSVYWASQAVVLSYVNDRFVAIYSAAAVLSAVTSAISHNYNKECADIIRKHIKMFGEPPFEGCEYEDN